MPFPALTVGFKTSPQHVDWGLLDETWAAAGELPAFTAGWMNDHLTDMSDAGGPSLESLTLMATLVQHVPGAWVGHAVLSNTFRHPAVVAKAAVVLDHATGGRFVIGLGAGWHLPEHRALGIPLPPIGERVDRLESAVDVLRALFSPEAGAPPGVSRPDPFYPLDGAVNLPAPRTTGGPPIFLGGQKRRGIGLAGRAGDGWLLPGDRAGDESYLAAKREELLRAVEAAGRDAGAFTIVGQVSCGESPVDRGRALDQAHAMQAAGATHIVLGMAPRLGADGLRAIAREVAEPLLDRSGWSARPG